MSKLNATDIQGFVLRGYNMPYARYCFLRFDDAQRARAWIHRLLGIITTGQLWDQGKPQSTINIAFTYKGLVSLDLPIATLISFPVEFQEGMQARGGILGDTGVNSVEHWDEVWREGSVHALLAINAVSLEALDAQTAAMQALMAETGGARVLDSQDAASIVVDGKVTLKEHFGFTDGFGNPDYLGVCRSTQPGQGKLMPDGTWASLATGELLLGYADEAGELPVAPVPALLASNGTFMVYRKLHQNVGTFRRFLEKWGARYGAGDANAREKLASKFIGRWRDGTPVESSPDRPDPAIAQDPNRSTNFTYGNDAAGTRCPVGAHIRRVNPRDAFGFEGRLINRRRITRRGLPYGPLALGEDVSAAFDPAEMDAIDRGVIFMALNASISRQFEFVQQQWISYGNDAHAGNERDLLMGNHAEGEKYVIQGDTNPANPPFICTDLPSFVELRGGEYFFLPSITALGMIAMGLVDPR
ncbi:MAG TPA: dyp-type peroxidase [Edaphobacter sp.]|nr:dyp-type peroxidase [Edaphobacter sp.]